MEGPQNNSENKWGDATITVEYEVTCPYMKEQGIDNQNRCCEVTGVHAQVWA